MYIIRVIIKSDIINKMIPPISIDFDKEIIDEISSAIGGRNGSKKKGMIIFLILYSSHINTHSL